MKHVAVLLVIYDISESAYGGPTLRNRSLHYAVGQADDTYVFDVRRTMAELGCRTSCEDCSVKDLAEYGSSNLDPYRRNYCRRAVEALNTLVRKVRPKLLYVSDLRMHQYVHPGVSNGTKIAIDMHNIESVLTKEVSEGTKEVGGETVPDSVVDAVGIVESYITTISRVITLVSRRDAELLKSIYGRHDTEVIPNSVDMRGTERPAVRRDVGPVDLIFTGHLGYLPNKDAVTDFCQRVLPMLSKKHVRSITIAGRDPSPTVMRLADTDRIRVLPNPPDARILLAGSVSIVPLRLGGGSRLKVLEAFAEGASVVSTRKGTEGLAGVLPGAHYYAAEKPMDWSAAIEHMLHEPEHDLKQRQAAYDVALTNYSWESIVPLIQSVLAESYNE